MASWVGWGVMGGVVEGDQGLVGGGVMGGVVEGVQGLGWDGGLNLWVGWLRVRGRVYLLHDNGQQHGQCVQN